MRNKTINRRGFFSNLAIGTVSLGTGVFFTSFQRNCDAETELPLLHVSDLSHPHGDPDDHFDLAVTYALARRGNVNLRGVVIECWGPPAVVAVAQMNRLAGFSVPVSIGTTRRMKNRRDSLSDAPVQETAAVRFICEQLRLSPQPVTIVSVGVGTDIAAAALREPELFHEKCAGIYLNSGSAYDNPEKPGMLESNVSYGPSAYAALFDLPCPLYWCPCWHTLELRESGEDGSFYWLSQSEALSNLSTGAANYFDYMFRKSSEPQWLKLLDKPVDAERWEKILNEKRSMWSTASQFLLAGLTVTKDGTIIPVAEAGDNAVFEMTPVEVTCTDAGRTTWKRTDKRTGRWMLHVTDVASYPSAITKAVASLLAEL